MNTGDTEAVRVTHTTPEYSTLLSILLHRYYSFVGPFFPVKPHRSR